MTDPLDDLCDEMAHAGQPVPELIPDGVLHRYDGDGKRGRRPCWYVVHTLSSGHVVAVYGDNRLGTDYKVKWRSWEHNGHARLSAEERKRFEQEAERAQRAREAQTAKAQANAAHNAKEEWGRCVPTGQSEYLMRKRIGAHGIRFGRDERGGYLAIPMRAGAKWRGIQRIYDDGTKRFTAGCEKRGAYALLGTLTERGPIYLCEGYATGATIFEATGQLVIIGFDAGNIPPVIESLIKTYRTRLVVCADNDLWSSPKIGNTGAKLAEEVRYRFNLRTILPDFEGWETKDLPTDFNDLAVLAGMEEVRRQLGVQNALEPHKSSGFSFVRAGQVTDLLSEPYLIEDVLPRESIGFIYGVDQTFKSFLLIDLLLCVATGRPWHGHPVQKGISVLIAGEGAHGIDKRVMAWCIRHLSRNTLPEDALFFRSTHPAAFCEGGNTSQVLAKLKDIERRHGKPAIVGIDTLRRNLGAGKESNPDDASISLNLIGECVVQPFGAVAAVVHHSGHASQERMRGASNFQRDTDWYYHVMGTDEVDRKITMTCGKLKDDELPAPFDFVMRVVELPFEKRRGVPMTSLIVEDTLQEEEGTESKRQDLAEVFIEAVIRQARKQVLTLMQQGFEVPPQIVVGLKEARAIFVEMHKELDRRRDVAKDWNRAKEDAVKKHPIEFAGRDGVTFPTDRLNLSKK